MNAHDYQGDGETCRECQRPPGNYIHIGLSDEQVAALGYREGEPLSPAVTMTTMPPPMTLIANAEEPTWIGYFRWAGPSPERSSESP